MKSIHKILCKSLFSSRRLYLLLLPLVGIGAWYSYEYSKVANQAQDGGQLSFAIYHSIFQSIIVLCIIIPSFLVIIEFINVNLDKCEVLLKYKNIRKWWADKNWGICLFSLIYIVIINAIVIAVIIFSGHGSQLNVNFLRYMFLGGLFQFLGFLILGNIYSIALLQIQHPSAGFFIAYAVIVLLDIIRDVSESLLTFDFVTLEEYMFLMSNKVNLWHGLWLLLIFMLLYQLGLSISRGKDIYWGER